MTKDLRTDLKQNAPFGSLEQEVFLNLMRTSAELEHDLAERLKPFGLTLTQYNALRILRGAGPDGLCRNEIRDRMIRPLPDATRLLDRLAEMGLVERGRESDDRRFVTTRITKRGLDLLARMDQPVAAMHATQLGHLSRADLRELANLLTQARKGD